MSALDGTEATLRHCSSREEAEAGTPACIGLFWPKLANFPVSVLFQRGSLLLPPPSPLGLGSPRPSVAAPPLLIKDVFRRAARRGVLSVCHTEG